MSPCLRVTTLAGTRELPLAPGDPAVPLTTLLARHEMRLNTRCGARGLCHGCEVRLTAGQLQHQTNAAIVGPGPDAEALRACQWHLAAAGGPVGLEVPARSLLRHAPAVVSTFRIGVPWARDPLRSDTRYGAAVDLGTTTVVVVVCELESGAVVGEAADFNAQIAFGEDVLTRIQACTADESAAGRLQRAVAAGTIAPLLAQACGAARIAPADVGVMTVAGNTTMLHLLAGADPRGLGVYPFTPVFLEHRRLAPREAGLVFGDAAAEVHLLPGPSAYVGADIAAGVVATGLLYADGPVLFVDVGTNGEIVAKVGDRLVGAATAAGPAFEGAGLTCGMRAATGAIERLRLTRDPFAIDCRLIGGGPRAIGVCGSAYVDFLWEARRVGLLQANGRFADTFLDQAGGAIVADRFGRRLRVHAGTGHRPVWISEVDIAHLLQAKAAIAAGIQILLEQLQTTAAQVKRVYLAGGFGRHLSREHAIGCGLLPGFTAEQIEEVGNSSLAGAVLALNDRSLLGEMARACAAIETVELNQQPGFEDAFLDHLLLPEPRTDGRG